MNSIQFPKMFTTAKTLTVTDHDATVQNILVFLKSVVNDFKDDPDFGVATKRFIYEQNDSVLADMLIDDLYTKIALFFPQCLVKRTDIKVKHKNHKVIISLKIMNRLDYTTNTYELVLFNEEGQ